MEDNKELEKENIEDSETNETNEVVNETNEEVLEDSPVEDNELEKLKAENADLTDRLQRNLAEFDNFRKRTDKEKSQMYNNGLIATVEKILPVLDNFERALNAQNDKESDFYKGVDMINKQFINLLSELGVNEIESLNCEFDPNLHYAVSHEDNEEFGVNEVIEVLQKGYTYKDKVIRFTMVKVAN